MVQHTGASRALIESRIGSRKIREYAAAGTVRAPSWIKPAAHFQGGKYDDVLFIRGSGSLFCWWRFGNRRTDQHRARAILVSAVRPLPGDAADSGAAR